MKDIRSHVTAILSELGVKKSEFKRLEIHADGTATVDVVGEGIDSNTNEPPVESRHFEVNA